MYRYHMEACGVHLIRCVTSLALVLLATTAQAVDVHYYIAVDNAPVLTSGTYAGQPNPNYGRLTFLVAHVNDANPSTNHFHSIGAYSYTGPANQPTVIATSSNNRLPEIATGDLPLSLVPGASPYTDKLISHPTDAEYSDLHMASIQTLSTFPSTSSAGILLRSSAERWSVSLAGAVVALQLVSITPELNIADAAGKLILYRKSHHLLGDGNSLTFFPTFWTHDYAVPGTYSATFKLVDMRPHGTPLGESGRFTIDFRVPRNGDYDGDNDIDWDDVLMFLNPAPPRRGE